MRVAQHEWTVRIPIDADVLVVAALEGQITGASAATVRARLLAEAANGPFSIDADLILRRNRVVVLTNSLTNAWGVILTYFE